MNPKPIATPLDAPHAAHLARILGRLVPALTDKYARGQAEHGGNLWEKGGMLAHAIEEVLDLAVYLYTLEEQQRPAQRVIYIAGPFRGASQWEQHVNIRRAEQLALEVWKLGAVAICPHANTAHFQGACDDAVWLRGDLELLRRSDAVLLTDDWRRSAGARDEVDAARRIGLPVFETVADLAAWLESCA